MLTESFMTLMNASSNRSNHNRSAKSANSPVNSETSTLINCIYNLLRAHEVFRWASAIFRWATEHMSIFLIKPRPNDRNMHNISQHCWAQHVASVWPPCCDVFQHVGCCLLKFETGQIWANNTQHVATRWPNARNMLRATMLRHVALACCYPLAGA